ncbi:MAG TPA: D-serine ammonia-lyase [Candidatus Dorea gallistercoris]|uniref:Probable D-serine dehydratase n=1 Tax=Candidatus Dorea gallistercoris TaxID=2838542 RepID=A0A9D1R974_9FIRM|nr:D-serine ammonia-lyase [Candidatus Dorea gallistercoris]
MNLDMLEQKAPVVKKLCQAEEVSWINPYYGRTQEALKDMELTMADVEDAAERLARFAPFIRKAFPETEATDGLIESPLREIPKMKEELNTAWKAGLQGKLLLKMDSHLAAAGSVKARGGIYEILKHAEDLALEQGMIRPGESYEKFADPSMKEFFSKYAVHVGSTGNLGLSIGIISATLGFRVYVHMSQDAKQWKKELLRSKNVQVIEYAGDYGAAVKKGREEALKDPYSYFVDDENSVSLFLGYAVAALRLQGQLEELGILVDEDHPLFVYIPCGVGGAPGGVTFGLKLLYGDHVHVFYEEPTQACCMILGIATGLHSEICVQDIGLSGKTEADGLAVGRPSKFVGKTVEHLLSGEFTIEDEKLYVYMKELLDQENVFIEPSSCAAFAGPARIEVDEICEGYIEEQGLVSKMGQAAHIVWATGGSLVPEDVREAYIQKAEEAGTRV